MTSRIALTPGRLVAGRGGARAALDSVRAGMAGARSLRAAIPSVAEGLMRKDRVSLAVTAAVGAVGTFLPWASLGLVSIDGTRGDGWFTLALFGVCLRAALVGDRNAPMHRIDVIASTIAATIAGGIAARAIAGLLDSNVQPGFGLYAIAGAAAVTVFMTPFNLPAKKLPTSIDADR